MMDTALNTLLDDLYNPDKNIRSKAAVEFGKTDDLSLVPALIDALVAEPDLNVREDLTWALVRLKAAAFQPLVALLSDANPKTRHSAVHVLTKIGGEVVVDALTGMLADSEPSVISKAAFGLAQVGDERAIPALVAIVGHENREVQTMLMDVLERFGEPSVQPLIERMNDERWQVREQAADSLGGIGDRAAVPVLVEALKDEMWQVRFSAVTALAHIGGVEAKAALQHMPEDSEPRVRELVAKVGRVKR
ncbi:MAG: HEAT repeat domain-containing protein [Chloroflexi bacterium]|nr:HEAT repeat domain-containing protein [Chloroflexota bacterium]MCC6893407.1 HEAT repeat domain-containing protein [Anaerolineae bacterium]